MSTNPRPVGCVSVGPNGVCCMPRGHRGLHQRPEIAWHQWADPDHVAICGMVSQSGPNGEPLACGYPEHHEGAHAWGTLPTFIRGATP